MANSEKSAPGKQFLSYFPDVTRSRLACTPTHPEVGISVPPHLVLPPASPPVHEHTQRHSEQERQHQQLKDLLHRTHHSPYSVSCHTHHLLSRLGNSFLMECINNGSNFFTSPSLARARVCIEIRGSLVWEAIYPYGPGSRQGEAGEFIDIGQLLAEDIGTVIPFSDTVAERILFDAVPIDHFVHVVETPALELRLAAERIIGHIPDIMIEFGRGSLDEVIRGLFRYAEVLRYHLIAYPSAGKAMLMLRIQIVFDVAFEDVSFHAGLAPELLGKLFGKLFPSYLRFIRIEFMPSCDGLCRSVAYSAGFVPDKQLGALADPLEVFLSHPASSGEFV